MIGLGLALAQPDAPVLVITGDGEHADGPRQPCHHRRADARPTSRSSCSTTGISARPVAGEPHPWRRRPAAVARGCGISRVIDVEDEAQLRELAGLLATSDRTLFARVRILPDEPPRALPEKDGVIIKDRVRRAVENASA